MGKELKNVYKQKLDLEKNKKSFMNVNDRNKELQNYIKAQDKEIKDLYKFKDKYIKETKKLYADLELGLNKKKDSDVKKVLDKYRSRMLQMVKFLDKQ